MSKGIWILLGALGLTIVLVWVLVISVVVIDSRRNDSLASSASNSSQPNQTDADRSDVASDIRQYLEDNFGIAEFKANWHDNIVNVSVKGDTVRVTTKSSRRDQKAERACMGVSGFVFDNTNKDLGLENIQVYGKGSNLLLERRGIGERCEK